MKYLISYLILLMCLWVSPAKADIEQDIRKDGIVVHAFDCKLHGKDHVCLLVAYQGEPYLVIGVLLNNRFEARVICQHGNNKPIWQGVST